MNNPHAHQFAGRWIGETQGHDMPAHVWDISVQGDSLRIEARWEHETGTGLLRGSMVPGEAAFTLHGFKAVLVGPQHFIVPGWDTNDTRGGVGPHYDVVFSRPGLPELEATEVWRAYTGQRNTII